MAKVTRASLRRALFVINGCYFVLSLVILILAVWIVILNRQYRESYEDFVPQYSKKEHTFTVAIDLMFVCVFFLAFAGVAGMFAIVRYNLLVLNIGLFFIFGLFCINIASAAISITFLKDQSVRTDSDLLRNMTWQVQTQIVLVGPLELDQEEKIVIQDVGEEYPQDVNVIEVEVEKYPDPGLINVSRTWYLLQYKFMCCGADSFIDYKDSNYSLYFEPIPRTCCEPAKGSTDPYDLENENYALCIQEADKWDKNADMEQLYTLGCYHVMRITLQSRVTTVIVLSIICLVFEVLSALIYMYL